MSDFTAIFTSMPLASLNLKCLKDSETHPYHEWDLGGIEIRKGLGWDDKNTLQKFYPDMYMYFSWYHMGPDFLDLAREYLEHDSKIIFFTSQWRSGNRIYHCPKKWRGEYTFDILDIPPGKMPMIDGKELDSEAFNFYIFVKGMKKPTGQSFR